MRTALLPELLLAVALGLALSYAAPKLARHSALLMLIIGLAIAFAPIQGVPEDLVFAGGWISVMAAAGSVHIPNGAPPWALRLIAGNAGVWAGLVSHIEGGPAVLSLAAPLLLLFIPGHILVKRNWGIAIKVGCSWLIAIAALELGLMFVPTPGYVPDHMD